jgi:GTP-binding protein
MSKSMRARSATFLTSAPHQGAFPPPTLPEIAFAGRSNVGKSSLLNTLVGVDGLARTSSTPGRTQALNWFTIVPPRGPELAFVDLPGYGYAQAPQDLRKAWQPLVEGFAKRETCKLFVVIVDIRRGPEREEAELFEWLASIQVPALLVCTKADKLPKNQRFPAAQACRRALDLDSPPLTFSAQTGDGVADLWRAVLASV